MKHEIGTTHSRQALRYNGGQAIITAVVFFLLITISVVGGVSGPILTEASIVRTLENSKTSYYVAESLHEDVVYRIIKGLAYDSAESLILDGYVAGASVTEISG